MVGGLSSHTGVLIWIERMHEAKGEGYERLTKPVLIVITAMAVVRPSGIVAIGAIANLHAVKPGQTF